MKKIIIVIAAVWMIASSCDERLENLNKPKKDPEAATAEALFANATRQMFDMMVETDVNANVFRLYAQYWAQTTYPDESQFNMVGRRIPDNFWENGYRDVLMDLTQAKVTIDETWEALAMDEGVRDNQYALINILKVYTFAVLTDAFGAVPFEEALNPDILSPAYDGGATVYTGIIDMLDNAIDMLNDEASAFSSRQDLIYHGDVDQWIKFANSLKLKLALTIADVNPTKAQTMIDEAVTGGLFAGNADNAAITYQPTSPSTNPIWKDLVQSGRSDYVIANTIVDKLNNLNDPRLFVYGEPTAFQYPVEAGTKQDSVLTQSDQLILIYSDVNGEDSIEYVSTPFTIFAADSAKELSFFSGGVYGTNNTYKRKSHVGDLFHQPDLEGLVMDYAEVQFMLAEAKEKGFIFDSGMTAEEHYYEGITASMRYWNIDETAIADYLTNPDVTYVPAEWEQKIGEQAWIAFYNRGFEGWSLWRRLDFDGFNAPPSMTLGDIPNRLIFPIEEYTLNPTHLDEAVIMIGGDDDASVKVFWDVN